MNFPFLAHQSVLGSRQYVGDLHMTSKGVVFIPCHPCDPGSAPCISARRLYGPEHNVVTFGNTPTAMPGISRDTAW